MTWGWLKAALDSIHILQDKAQVGCVQTPCFFAIAGKDVVVDNDGTRRVASFINDAELEFFESSEHQMHAERDEIRNALLNSFYAFIEKHLP